MVLAALDRWCPNFTTKPSEVVKPPCSKFSVHPPAPPSANYLGAGRQDWWGADVAVPATTSC